MRYHRDDTHTYRPPDCPVCGGETIVGWVPTDCAGEAPGTYYSPGVYACLAACEVGLTESAVSIGAIDDAFAHVVSGLNSAPTGTTDGD